MVNGLQECVLSKHFPKELCTWCNIFLTHWNAKKIPLILVESLGARFCMYRRARGVGNASAVMSHAAAVYRFRTYGILA